MDDLSQWLSLRKASTRLKGLLLVSAIKGDQNIIHFN